MTKTDEEARLDLDLSSMSLWQRIRLVWVIIWGGDVSLEDVRWRVEAGDTVERLKQQGAIEFAQTLAQRGETMREAMIQSALAEGDDPEDTHD